MRNYSNPITVSGNPATFTVQNAKVLSLSVPIVPTQDLHGYANPWPAGGGKNITSMESVTTVSNGGINEATSGQIATLQGGITYTISFDLLTAAQPGAGYSNRLGIYYNNTTAAARFELTATGRQTATFTPPSDCYINFWCGAGVYSASTKVIDNIQLEKGSTATSYAPYSNICPISGRTGLSVYVSPTQNQADATTYNSDWTSEAGTVYGGSLDVVTGVLTVDRVCETITKDSAWYSFSTGTGNSSAVVNLEYYNNCKYVDGISSRNGAISSTGEETGNYWIHARQNEVPVGDMCFAYSYTGYVRFHRTDVANITDLNAFKAAFPDTQICYYLATPLTYQLTAQEVELIKGLNNVWADTNTTITLSYALLYFIRQKLIVNGTDLSEYVERDSYRTSLTPVYGQTIETLNGVQHTALLRLRGALKVGLNPQTDTDTATICTALLNTPCQVTYHCLQRDADVTSLMKVDPISAQFLSRCLFLGDEWNDIDDITLTEL